MAPQSRYGEVVSIKCYCVAKLVNNAINYCDSKLICNQLCNAIIFQTIIVIMPLEAKCDSNSNSKYHFFSNLIIVPLKKQLLTNYPIIANLVG